MMTRDFRNVLSVLCCLAAGLWAVSAALTAYADDAGKAKAAVCVACHGENGISGNPLWPNLAGQKDQYLILQLKAFRDGTRKHALMSPMAAGLSDDDIASLAAYYSALSPVAEKPAE